jgi:hypothetical protein
MPLSTTNPSTTVTITQNTTLTANAKVNKNIILEATATAANQTIIINKYFGNAYTVDW